MYIHTYNIFFSALNLHVVVPYIWCSSFADTHEITLVTDIRVVGNRVERYMICRLLYCVCWAVWAPCVEGSRYDDSRCYDSNERTNTTIPCAQLLE